MAGMQAIARGTRTIPALTSGKVYEVIEHLPAFWEYGAGWQAPAYVVVTNDHGKKATYHASRFELIEEEAA